VIKRALAIGLCAALARAASPGSDEPPPTATASDKASRFGLLDAQRPDGAVLHAERSRGKTQVYVAMRKSF
jgi:hypothetical protein